MWEIIERMATDLSVDPTAALVEPYLVRHFYFGSKTQKWLHGQLQNLIKLRVL